MSWLLTGNVLFLQLDESTDIVNDAIWLCNVRYFYNCKIYEVIILYFSKHECTGRNIFVTLVNFFTNNNLDLVKCVSVTTNGTDTMTGKQIGLVQLI